MMCGNLSERFCKLSGSPLGFSVIMAKQSVGNRAGAALDAITARVPGSNKGAVRNDLFHYG